jgi:hypothetical protein
MNWKCEQHADPTECSDALIGRVGKNKTLGLLIHDGSSFIPTAPGAERGNPTLNGLRPSPGR